MMRGLVIGASGFLGLHLVDHLIAQGLSVRASYRQRAPTPLLRKRPVELVPASLQDRASLEQAMEGCDCVFLVAGHYPRYSLHFEAQLETAVLGVRNACDAALARGVKRLIYTSSSASLASRSGQVTDEDDVPISMPRHSVYRAVKWAMEREVEDAQQRGLSTVTLLPGGCIGPGDYRLGTGGLFVAAVLGILPFWVEGYVNLVDVTDVARAQLAAVSAPGSRYCLAPHTRRFGELLHGIVQRYGGKVPEQVSARCARERADAAERAAEPRKARVTFPRELVDVVTSGAPIDCSRARRELGVDFAPLEPAFDRAHAFFRRVGFLPDLAAQERHVPHE